MIGQVKHVNQRLQDFLEQEDAMTRHVKKFKQMPQIFKSFEEIPKKLEQQTQMLTTIDAQLKEIQQNFQDVSQKALDVYGQSSNKGSNEPEANLILP